ncbi:hypothetical protein HYI36_20015 [Bacillus sp. Gen3]|nr:hypothetical protein [Bacillus sp. Gen3]
MAVYKSKYRELKFYVGRELHAFSGGSFSTTDESVIAVLDKLTDAKRVDEVKTEEVAPKPKAPAKKKSSGK